MQCQCGWVDREDNETCPKLPKTLSTTTLKLQATIGTSTQIWKTLGRKGDADRLCRKVRELTDKMNHLGTQLRLPNEQGRSPSDGHLPGSIIRTLYPLLRNAGISHDRTTIAHQASSDWDSTRLFPPERSLLML
jgi:hypothetical protein